jgi:SAM-dependent methyltransferase
MEDILLDEMFLLEQTHWWFSAKHSIVLSLLDRWLSPRGQTVSPPLVYDLGCGCGAMLKHLREQGYNAIGMDSNDRSLHYCRQRQVPVQKGYLPDGIPADFGKADAVLLLDVLEHIEDDRAALSEAARIVSPGGLLILTVPACPWLWTRRDVYHHHFRRYTRSGLSDMIRSIESLTPLVISYMNAFLFPLAAVERGFRKLAPPIQTDLRVPPPLINRILYNIYRMERHFFSRSLSLPCGLSLIAVMRKG